MDKKLNQSVVPIKASSIRSSSITHGERFHALLVDDNVDTEEVVEWTELQIETSVKSWPIKLQLKDSLVAEVVVVEMSKGLGLT